LIPFLAEFDVRYPDYGYILGLETKIVNPVIVGSLQPYIEDGDILIGHSNGCAIAYELAHSSKPAGLIFINAALDQAISRPAPWIDVYFNAGDQVTEAAKIGAALGIDDPVWGEMGHAGYSGDDPMIANIDCGNSLGMPAVSGHSAFFDPQNLRAWGPYLVNRLRDHLAA